MVEKLQSDLAKSHSNKENRDERSGTASACAASMPIETYRDLETWQACMDVLVETHQLTRKFPEYERYGMSGQMHRASLSMPSNVAEGEMDIAIGSHAELETCAEAARRLKYVSDDECSRYGVPLARAGQLVNGLLRSLEARKKRESPESRVSVFEASRECRARIPSARC